MALIECPACGKQISERATQCPMCGYKNPEHEVDLEEVKCYECGAVLGENDLVCPVCGCPVDKQKVEEVPQKVEVTGIKIPVIDKRKKSVFIVVTVVVAALILGTISGVFILKKNNSKKYMDNLSSASSTMFMGAFTAESAGRLIHDVWYNTIYKESDIETDKFTKNGAFFRDDFNDSLRELMSDEDFKKDINYINSNQEMVNDILKELVNPSDEYKEAYDKLQDLYDAYLELTNLVIDPSGNLTSYTSSFNSADTAFSNAYKAMKRYVD